MLKVISREMEKTELYLKQIKFFCLPILFLFLSCSGEAPQVVETFHQLNLINDPATGTTYESLSLFIHGEDEDGEDDLEQIYLIYDDLHFFWNISSSQWSILKDQGVRWIGFNNILAPGEGRFPEGDYRVLLMDIGGERDEKSFYLRNNIPLVDDLTFPEITFDNNNLSVTSDYRKFQVWFYGDEEQFLEKSKNFLMSNYEWNDIIPNIRRRASSFKIYMEPETGSWGFISGPFVFKDQL